MAKTEWLKKTLPQGFKKEFLGPEQQSHRVSRGRDFLKVEFLRYYPYCRNKYTNTVVEIDSAELSPYPQTNTRNTQLALPCPVHSHAK